jgi:hypothetical protein
MFYQWYVRPINFIWNKLCMLSWAVRLSLIRLKQNITTWIAGSKLNLDGHEYSKHDRDGS